MPPPRAGPPPASLVIRQLAIGIDVALVGLPVVAVVVGAGLRGPRLDDPGVLGWVDGAAIALAFPALTVAEAVGGATLGAAICDLEVWAPGDRRWSWAQVALRAQARVPEGLVLRRVPLTDRLSGTRLCSRHSPGSALPNAAALARAEARWEELTGVRREMLGEALTGFRVALELEDRSEIDEARGRLLEMLDWMED